jgi:membrane protease YdiL (CAAX protease family)
VLWCVVFLAAQVIGFVVIGAAVLGIEALVSGAPGEFLDREFNGTSGAFKATPPGADRADVPVAMARAMAWGFFGAQVLSLALILFILPRWIGRDWKRQIGVRRPAGLHVFLTVLVLPGFIILSSGLGDLFIRWVGAKPIPGTEQLRGVFAVWPVWLAVLAVGVGPGIVEELWCRGFLGRGLCARYGLVIGVLLTSILFALLHLHPVHAIIYAAMGGYLHFIYLCSRSIWVPILLHALNNGVAAFAELTGVLVQLNANPSGLSPVLYLAAGALAVFVSVAFWTGRAVVQSYAVEKAGGPGLGWQPEYPMVSAPPPGVEARIGYRTVSPVAVVNAVLAFGAVIYLLTLRGSG